jgi:hypothetical protein
MINCLAMAEDPADPQSSKPKSSVEAYAKVITAIAALLGALTGAFKVSTVLGIIFLWAVVISPLVYYGLKPRPASEYDDTTATIVIASIAICTIVAFIFVVHFASK